MLKQMFNLTLLIIFGCIGCIVEATKKALCNGWTLTAPKEGSFSCHPQGVQEAMAGTRCTLNCDSGYRPEHTDLFCSSTGGWEPADTPKCVVDSTMTLVIVLSIVGSIIIILALSIVYARASKRCRGRRRRLEEEDPELAGRRSDVNDTSAYYQRIRRLRRKRRLQAERQRQVIEKTKKKEASVDKRVTQSEKRKVDSKTRDVVSRKRTQKTKNTKERSKNLSQDVSARRKMILPRRKKTQNKELQTSESQKQPKPKNSFAEILNQMFCCCSGNKKKVPNPVVMRKEETRIKTISEASPPPLRATSSGSSTTSSSSTSSACSSSSSESSSEDESPPKKEAKKIDDSSTPASRAAKPPSRPPPPGKKKPPPRPPAPKNLPVRVTKVLSREVTTRIQVTPRRRHSVEERTRMPTSSGYSSEENRHHRKRRNSEGGLTCEPVAMTTPHSHSTVVDSELKRMKIPSPGPGETEQLSGNPYDNYPAALSYRQYQNFENDYRRTTGDYHPQYSNVKLIPIQLPKERIDKTKEHERTEEKQKEKRLKSVQGGMKYISISDEKNDNGKMHRSDRKLAERYQDPSARDKRRNSPDYHHRSRPAKRQRKEHKESKTHSKSKHKRKKQIEDEKIIDNGTKNRESEKNKDKTDSKHKQHQKRIDKSKHKKRPA